MIHWCDIGRLPRQGLDYISCTECTRCGEIWKLSSADRLRLVKLMARERGQMTVHVHAHDEWLVARYRVGARTWTQDHRARNFEALIQMVHRLL